jgi:hypothetical protein
MSYPSTIYTQTDVAGTTLVATDDHAARHNAVGDELVAIETALGTHSGTSVLKNFTAGKFAARTIGETFGTNTWIGGTIGTTLIGTSTIQGGTVNSKIGLMTNGTIGTTLMGTSTIQGGTANLLDLRGYLSTPQYATAAGTGGTTTLDLNLTNDWRVTFGTNNATLAVSNAVDGKKFLVSLTQDAVGTRTVVWFNTIKWTDGNGTPTLTVTANKRDTFGFNCTSGSTFDGYIVGQEI